MAGITPSNFNVKVANTLKNNVVDLSLSKPLIISRTLEKFAFPHGPNSEKRKEEGPDLEALRALLEEYGLFPKGKAISEQEWDNWNKQLSHDPPS